MQIIKGIYKPEIYHGFKKDINFFEGWFYKIVDKHSDNSFAIIPGIIKTKSEKKSFIQVISSDEKKSFFIEYPAESFYADKDKFYVKIENSEFSLQSIKLDIDASDLKLTGTINIESIIPWDVTLFSPGVMGKFAFVPYMETFHGVLSLDSKISGFLLSNSKNYNFQNGKAYIEKDWGSSFPSAYIWLQANNFPNHDTSIFVSIAKIPWLGKWFTGYICGFLYRGKLYKFATYNRTKLDQFKFDHDKAQIIFKRNDQTLKISALQKDKFSLLAPYNNTMNNEIFESLNSEIEVEFYIKDKLIYKGKSLNAGFEHNGNVDILTTQNK